ncbi:MAG: S1C family serine protease [Planctomycetota bacterium]
MSRGSRILATILATSALAATPTFAGGFDQAIEKCRPRVVKLYGAGAGKQAGYGSGVLVSGDGLVVTVFSLLIDARQIRAVTADGKQYLAEVVRRDAPRQLALLRLRAEPNDPNDDQPVRSADEGDTFPYFEVSCPVDQADSGSTHPRPCDELVRPGDWVITAGNPFKIAEGAEPVSFAHGVFSARTRLDARRRVKDFPYHGDVLVIDAVTSNPGAPGSALVNLNGEFVGMIGREVISNLTHTHLNYAVPRDVLDAFLREATRAAPVAEPGLADAVSSTIALPESAAGPDDGKETIDIGIRLTRTGYKSLPPIVERVQRGSLAAQADIRKDDVILSINGRAVPDIDAYEERLERLGPDEAIELVIRRGRQVLTTQVLPRGKAKPSDDGHPSTKPESP